MMQASSSEGSSSGYPNKTVVKENGVTIEHNYPNDHGNPAHLHVKGEGQNTKIGQGRVYQPKVSQNCHRNDLKLYKIICQP